VCGCRLMALTVLQSFTVAAQWTGCFAAARPPPPRTQVFTVPVLHLRMTFLIGPSVAPHFYNAADDLMSQKEVYGYSVPTFGDSVVFAVDEKVRAEQFRMLADALKSTKMKDYVPTFVKESKQFVAKWGDSGVIDFKDQFSELILFTASATILGREVREGMFKEVTHLYDALDQGAQPCRVPSSCAPR
jgi:sterol 14alpha-demethylase